MEGVLLKTKRYRGYIADADEGGRIVNRNGV